MIEVYSPLGIWHVFLYRINSNIVTPMVGVCNCSMFCCTLLYIHSSIAIILMGKRELIALLNLSSWCLVMVERLFLAMPRGCLQFVIVVFPDHTHYFGNGRKTGPRQLSLSQERCAWTIPKIALNKISVVYPLQQGVKTSQTVSKWRSLAGVNVDYVTNPPDKSAY